MAEKLPFTRWKDEPGSELLSGGRMRDLRTVMGGQMVWATVAGDGVAVYSLFWGLLTC